MITLNRTKTFKKQRMQSTTKFIVSLILILSIFSSIKPVSAASPVNLLIYTVNIGDTASENNHNLFGWGPIEPDTHGGNWGGADDGSLRCVWYNDSANPSDIPTTPPDEEWAKLNISISEGFTAYRIYIRALDGLTNDSFEVLIEDEIVFTYNDQETNETWKTHRINLLPYELKGNLEIKIRCLSTKWSNFDTWGQLAVSWIKLYAREDKLTTVTLTNSLGVGLTNAFVQYYCGSWKDIGYTNLSGNITKFIPAGNYRFKITYENASVSKRQDINQNQTVLFKTNKTIVKLQDSNENGLPDGIIKYNAGGWKDFGITNSSGFAVREVLPRKYSFKAIWDNASVSKSQDIRIDSVVFFNTTKTKIILTNSNNSRLSGGNVSYYSGYWKNIGLTNESGEVSKELLPKRYRFKMIYDNATIYKTQDIRVDPIINFSTANVTIKLTDSKGNPILGGNVSYSSSGWKNIGTTNINGEVSKEILPKKYRFKMIYDNSAIYKTQDVSINTTVIFSTIEVTVTFKNSSGSPINNSKIQFYAGGWKDFGVTNVSGMVKSELIPKKYTFKVLWDNNSVTKKQDLNIDSTVIFSTIKTTVKLVNKSLVGIPGGIVSYYSAGWKDFGTTNATGETINDLLPRKYTFRMNYNGSRVNIYQNLAENPIVVFNTTYLYNKRPISRTNGPYNNFTNTSITFNGSESYDPDGIIVNYTWILGDGNIKYGQIINHSYTIEGLYVVRLKVLDDIGALRTSRTYANITLNPEEDNNEQNPPENNEPNNPSSNPSTGSSGNNVFSPPIISNEIPIAVADGPYEGYINIDLLFNGSQSTDDGSIVNYTWDFGDGTKGHGKTVTHSYDKIGIYEIALEITDDNGETDIFITSVDIRDIPNTVPSKPLINYTIKSNQYTFNISAFDPDEGDLIRFIIDWGDNTTDITDFIPNNSNFTINHSWEKPGNYTITIQTDDNKTLSKTTELSINISSQIKTTDLNKEKSDDLTKVLIPIFIILFGIILFVFLIVKNRIKNNKKQITNLKTKNIKKIKPIKSKNKTTKQYTKN